jgi:hypothetical protein
VGSRREAVAKAESLGLLFYERILSNVSFG